MTPRERLLSVLRHQEPDRLVIDFGGTDCSSIHLRPYDQLRKMLGIEPRPIVCGELIQQIADMDNEIQNRFYASAKGLFPGPSSYQTWNAPYGVQVLVPSQWNPVRLKDEGVGIRSANGTLSSKMAKDGFYFDPVSFPLANITDLNELDTFDTLFERWDYSPVFDESVQAYGSRAHTLYKNTDKAVVASWRMHFLQAGQIMRGYETFMIDLLTDEPLVRRMMEKLLSAYKRRVDVFAPAIKGAVDIIFLTDDLGTQNTSIIAPKTYRSLIKPYIAELVKHIKKCLGIPVLMHSCGAIREFIPDLIEIGIDAINPVQIAANGMEPAALKKDFGRDITFWGGGCDTQHVLSKGTPKAVAEEAKRLIDIFSPEGGFVFTQVHNIQPDVPSENIISLYETAMKYGGW